MKVTCDPEADTLYITLKDEPVAKTSHRVPGLIVDHAKDGDVIGIEILQASQKVSDLSDVGFALTA